MKCPGCQAENEPSAKTCTACGRDLSGFGLLRLGELRPGMLFDSRYEILAALGRGGMGSVYKARDVVLDETVAIKVLRSDYAWDANMAERFKSEIKLARKVRHKNVCTIHDFGEFEGLLYISMEFIDGIDLKRILKQKGAPPAPEAYELALQVARGLEAVHEAGIIHRDLKSANVMRDTKGVVRLMDFGVAKKYGSGQTITTTGQVIGTPEYMSPEQAQGHKLDFRSDIYALGILIYELFTGRVPFRGDTPISTILKQIHEPPPLFGPASAAVPGALLPVLRKALAKEPAGRFDSVRDLIAALEKARLAPTHPHAVPTAVTEATTMLAPSGEDERPAHPHRHLPARAVPLVLTGAAFLVAASWLYWERSGAVSKEIPASTATTTAPTGKTPLQGNGVAGPAGGGAEATPPAVESPASTIPGAATSLPTSSVVPPQPPATTTTAPPAASSVVSSVPTTSVPATTTSAPVTTSTTTAVPAGTGWLQVAVVPWAEVSVDGKRIGETPLDRLALTAGPHVIRLRHPDYEPVDQRITVGANETVKLVVNLRRDGVRKKN